MVHFKNDSTSIIVNESAVSIIGVSPEEVIGKRYAPLGSENPEFFTIIGVVKDFNFNSFHEEIKPYDF